MLLGDHSKCHGAIASATENAMVLALANAMGLLKHKCHGAMALLKQKCHGTMVNAMVLLQHKCYGAMAFLQL